MRVLVEEHGLRVLAVAGSHVVMFGLHMAEEDCDNLAGFAIFRHDLQTGEAGWLSGTKVFAETDPGLVAGNPVPTRDHPLQTFQWADYGAAPGRAYHYLILALKGPPSGLEVAAEVGVALMTESPAGGTHDIWFNRGTAASQEYVRHFGDRAPHQVANDAAFRWLSRGLWEALTDFVDACGEGDGLRVAAYEFRHAPFLERLAAARDRGVDLRIVMDARQAALRETNRAAVAAAGLEDAVIERVANPSYIAHNKFILRLRDGIPEAVWTGGTNFSEGGIFGHSNVAHVVEEAEVAAHFLDYWAALADDPERPALAEQVEAMSPLPDLPPERGTTPIFSPRRNTDALRFYADLALTAREGLFMTFAFGMNALFRDVYRDGEAPFRLALMESITRPMRAGPERDAEVAAIRALRRMPENTFAIGGLVEDNRFDGWLAERLTGLNSHVRFVHNKFMLVDPLSDDPVVVTGSANFSDASTLRNDENMLVICGNTRVADIYLGEFMRLYTHHAFRESLSWRQDQPRWLETGDWWRDYFGDTARGHRRRFFARVTEPRPDS